MPQDEKEILGRAIDPKSVKADGWLTTPRSYGVYLIPAVPSATLRYRFGNHPVRMRELEREFGSCQLECLFLSRQDARAVAKSLNYERD